MNKCLKCGGFNTFVDFLYVKDDQDPILCLVCEDCKTVQEDIEDGDCDFILGDDKVNN